MAFIPYGRQSISEEDIEAVVEVLRSDFLTQGPALERFEQGVADYVGAAYAVATNSATSALHLACLALGVGPGDWVWTTPNTFVASANCALYCGADVDFVDIDPHTYNLSIEALAQKLEQAEKENRLPKVVIPVHFAGFSCDMEAIHRLGQYYDFRIIEDASHAIGGRYQGQQVGSCHFSDITVFSFHPVKIITTCEGGMALTNRSELAEKMQLLRAHGITRNPMQMRDKLEGEWYYQQIELGFNYRMSDVQAALGLSQLERLDEWIERRHQLADGYSQRLQVLPLQLPLYQTDDVYSALHLYPVALPSSVNRKFVFDQLRAQEIGVQVHYIPVHTQPYYQSLGFRYGDYPVAEDYYQRIVTLPLFPALTEQQQEHVVDELFKIMNAIGLEDSGA